MNRTSSLRSNIPDRHPNPMSTVPPSPACATTRTSGLPLAFIAAAMKAKGRPDVRVVAQAGDGGTVDIGFGCLSGMFERNDDVLFICYDNEAYMNTGVQRSGATPPAARTATTEAIGSVAGNPFGQGKDLP